MTVQRIVEKFINNPKYLTNGAGRLSRIWNCSKEDVYEARRIVKNKNKYGTEYNPKDVAFKPKGLPKILVFDIETSPTIAYTWRRFQENISLSQVIQDPMMLTWAAKWLYNDDTMSDAITPEEILNEDDSRIVKSLWGLMDEADIVVGHYGDRFDIPMMNARAIINGLPPYSSIRSIDTCKVAKATFKFPSNKLDALGEYLELGQKLPTTFNLWKQCMEGRQEAITEMQVYNIQDVVLLEKVYLKLRPYIKSHPNVAVYMNSEEKACSVCGSSNIVKTDKYQPTNTGKFKLWRCECGALSRGRRTDFDKTKTLLTSAPR